MTWMTCFSITLNHLFGLGKGVSLLGYYATRSETVLLGIALLKS